MTWALCCSCGEIKFGAICPCPKCQVESTGNMQLDITFSDHYLDPSTLKEFGGVIQSINQITEDRSLRYATFFYYISENHSSILKYNPSPEVIPKAIAVLGKVDLPNIEVKPGRNGKRTDTTSESTRESSSEKQKWWQFWRRGP